MRKVWKGAVEEIEQGCVHDWLTSLFTTVHVHSHTYTIAFPS
jgi:hypothetical protein